MGSEVEHYTAPEVERAVPEVVNEHTDGWIRVLQPVAELASQVAGTEFVPVAIRQKPAAITAAILFGRELDMPPMQSLSQVHIIEGRPSLSAEQMRAMVLAAGHEIAYDLSVPMQVTATGRRWYGGARGWGSPTAVTWNIAMAERAALLGKNNWKRHPRQMLEARATAELCRLIFADVTHGLPTTEELEDGGAYDDTEGGDQGVTPPPASGRTKVSRGKARGTVKAAAGPAPEPPVQESVPTAPRPPLPGTGQTIQTEGPDAGEPISSTPVADTDGFPEDAAEPERCPVESHGHQCRYYANHDGKHSYGGGVGDPVDTRRCKIAREHDSHAWNDRDGWHSCSGDLLEQDTNLMSEGDGSADDVAATATEEQYAEMQEAAEEVAEAEIVPEVPEGIHPGQKRAVEAAFGSLGLKDRAEIHHAVSAILGRRVTTLAGASWGEGGELIGLTAQDGSTLLNALSKIRDRADLEALIQRAAEEWQGNP